MTTIRPATLRLHATRLLDTAQLKTQFPEWLLNEIEDAGQCMLQAAEALEHQEKTP